MLYYIRCGERQLTKLNSNRGESNTMNIKDIMRHLDMNHQYTANFIDGYEVVLEYNTRAGKVMAVSAYIQETSGYGKKVVSVISPIEDYDEISDDDLMEIILNTLAKLQKAMSTKIRESFFKR